MGSAFALAAALALSLHGIAGGVVRNVAPQILGARAHGAETELLVADANGASDVRTLRLERLDGSVLEIPACEGASVRAGARSVFAECDAGGPHASVLVVRFLGASPRGEYVTAWAIDAAGAMSGPVILRL